MSALVTAADLLSLQGRSDVVVVDVQYALAGPPSRDLYAVSHLPGAAHLPLDEALAGPPGVRGRHPLPDPEVLQNALRECGIREGSAVIVYDQQSSLAAARAWWVLRWAGLTDVRVLDGGLAAWVRAGGAATTDPARPARGDVVVRPGSLPLVEVQEVPSAAAAGRLLDVRTPERYRGEVEPIDRLAGHIPGAINLPIGLMQHPDGTFRSPDEIRSIAADVAPEGSGPAVTSCGSGVTAAQMVLALSTAGIEAVPYIGSWSEWIADPSRPVATGPSPR